MCHNCGKKGHIAAACRGGTHNQHQRAQRSHVQKGKTILITLSPCNTGSMVGLHMFALEGDVPTAILVDVLIEGKMLSMEVFTGLAVSVISRDMLQSLLPQVIPSKIHLQLQTFTGEKLPLVGMVRVKVSYRKQMKLLTLYITENPGLSLLGREWISKLKLNAFE